jgi:DNA-binding transcriptional MerR regulator
MAIARLCLSNTTFFARLELMSLTLTMTDQNKPSLLPADDIFWLDESNADAATPDAELTIGEMSRSFQVSTRTLRYYENRGLLKPRRHGTTRIYTQSDCHRIAAVIKARKLGFTLTEIKEMIEASEGGATLAALQLNRERCMRQIEHLARQRQEIEQALAELWRIHTRLSVRVSGGGKDESTPN